MDEKLIRDALGSPVPQYFVEDKTAYAVKTLDGRIVLSGDINFGKTKLLRDKYGSVLPQLWDAENNKWVLATSQNVGGGGAEVGEVKKQLDTVKTQLAETANQKVDIYKYEVNPHEAVCSNALNRLTIPTYNEGDDGEVVHPKVLYFLNKWNGYHYWMAMTPYQNNNNAFENPSIVVSNDGLNWTVPTGLTNPLVKKPTVGFNADTDLFMDSFNQTMYLVYKHHGAVGDHQIKIMESTDGINWSSPIPILVTNYEVLAPNIVWDGEYYNMFFVRGDTVKFSLVKSKSLTSGWSTPISCNINIPAGLNIWHTDVVKYYGQYHALVMTSPGTGNDGKLFFAVSNDGINWDMTKEPILTRSPRVGSWDSTTVVAGLYKSTLIPKMSNEGLKYGIYYGTNDNCYLGYTELTFDKTKRMNQEVVDLFSASNSVDSWIVGDTFNRPNSSTELGVTTSGQTWTPIGGVLGVSAGKAYAPTAGDNKASINIGTSNFYMRFTARVDSTTGEALIQFRRVDNTNFWRIGLRNNVLRIDKYLGTLTTNALLTPVVGKDVKIELECNGDVIKVWGNGTLLHMVTSNSFNTATIIALQLTTTDARIDNLLIRRI